MYKLYSYMYCTANDNTILADNNNHDAAWIVASCLALFHLQNIHEQRTSDSRVHLLSVNKLD